MTSLFTHINFIKSSKNFRILWYVDILLSFGAWFSSVAIYTMLIKFGASDVFISLIAAIHWLPGVLQAPITGIIVEKLPTKRLIFILLVVELLATLVLLIITPNLLWLIFIIVFVKMSCSSFLFTTMQSVLPKFLQKDSLRYANNIVSVTWSLSFIAGMALGGLVVAFYGVSFAILFDCALFVLAIFVLQGLNIKESIKNSTQKFTTMLKDGFTYLQKNKKIIKLILLHASVGLTSFDALVAMLAKNNYSLFLDEPLAIGVINAVRALGLFLGVLFFSKFKENLRLLFWLLLLQGFAIILWGILQFDFYSGLMGAFFTGFFTTSIWSVSYSLVQQNTQKDYLGRVVAYNDMVFLATNALVSLLISFFVAIGLSLWLITVFLGLGFLGFSLYLRLTKLDLN